MKIRREQLAAMAGPSTTFRTELCSLLNEHRIYAFLESPDGDLILPGITEGIARIAFDRTGRPAAITASTGRAYRVDYDETNRPIAIVDMAGHKVGLHFDESNRLARISLASGMQYDLLYESGLPVEIRRLGVASLRFRYDGNGNVSAIVDAKGHVQAFEYDTADRLIVFEDRARNLTTYSYGQDGLLRTISTPVKSVWRASYDTDTDKSTITFPDGSFEEYRPSQAPTEIRRRDGTVVSLTYDDKLRVTEARYPRDTAVRLSYNSLGHVSVAANGVHDVYITYDDVGYRSSETVDGRCISFERGADNLLQILVNHRHEQVAFEYGADQRIKKLRDWDGRTYCVSFDAVGQPICLEFPNGAQLTDSFAVHGVLEAQNLRRRGYSNLTRSYKYDVNDVLAEVIDSEHGSKRHVTDDEDRLRRVASRFLTREYRYDVHGNLVSVDGKQYSYNELDQIQGSPDERRHYDQLGNLVEWANNGTAFRYIYNGQNQLVRIESASGIVAEYEYDALGRRIVKRVGETTTTFTWWGDQLLAEDVDGPAPRHVDYLFLPGTCRLLAMRVNGATYYAQTDHLQCPIRLIDSAGRVVWAAEPHGYEYTVLVNEIDQPVRFPGQYFDAESGLHYNRHRYYDPRTGRFLSPDPLLFTDRTNLYQYAGGNPALFCDPDGLLLPLLVVGGALLVGAALGAGHSIASDLSQGRSPNWGNALKGAGNGVLVAAGGLVAATVAVATLPVTAPAAAVLAIGAAGALITGAAIAGVQAPEGQGLVACAEAVPFVRQFTHDYERDPTLKYPLAQRVVDGSFDLLTLGLVARGGRAVRGATVGDIRAAVAAERAGKPAAPSDPRTPPGPAPDAGSKLSKGLQDAGLKDEIPLKMEPDVPGGGLRRIPSRIQNGKIRRVLSGGKVGRFTGTQDFVLTNDGRLVVGRGHSVVSDGKSVAFAGQLKFGSDGVLKEITNNSGHYLPESGKGLTEGAKKYLGGLGVDVSNAKVTEVGSQ